MPSSLLQIRRSPAATVDAAIPAEGELAYKTDTKSYQLVMVALSVVMGL